MAIDLECGICGQSHRFRDEHAGRRTRCKECTARIDIPRGGLGGVLDGTTPIFTAPVMVVGSFVLVAVLAIGLWELIGSFGSAMPLGQVASPAPRSIVPESPISASPSSSPKLTQSASVSSPESVSPRVASSLPATPVDRTALNAELPKVDPKKSAVRPPPTLEELARFREFYARQGTPLVSFATPDNQTVQIREISPTWAEPEQPLRLSGRGLAKTSRVLAIDNSRFREHELSFRIVSDFELEVSAPPTCEKRNESVFVFEVYTPDGVAVTLPRELVDASGPIMAEFAIIRSKPISRPMTSFVILDKSGKIETVNTSRIYLLTPDEPPAFTGVVTKLLRTEQSTIGRIEGPKVESVIVPAIFPCYLDRMFAGPECRARRLLVP